MESKTHKKHDQLNASIIATGAVRVAKYLAAHGYAIRRLSISRSGRSAYVTVKTAYRRVQIRISDHPRKYNPDVMLWLKCYKSWHNQRGTLRHFMKHAGPPLQSSPQLTHRMTEPS